MKANASGKHTLYLVAILNGCVGPRDGSPGWLRPAADCGAPARPIAPSKRRRGRLSAGARGR